MTEGAVVGIDLGTTYSVCAIVENGRARVVSDTGGSYTIPSIVAIDDKGNRLVGQAAKRQNLTNPVNTVFGSKRLVGRDINSAIIDEVQDHVRYRILEGEQADVRIKMRAEEYALEEIQAMILDYVRNTAQDMLGQPITKAVVTVPAYFNDRQRHAVREAGDIAHLEVLRIINEPTAAALAYGYGKELQQKIVIFDLGGGTFDVCILELRNNVFEVKATGGNTFLGGVDFDNRIAQHMITEFKDRHKIDLARDPMCFQRVTDAAEQAKIDLSTRPETRIHIPYITAGPEGPLNIDIVIKREQFEEMIRPLIQEALTITEKVVKESGWTKAEIDAVLLVGGSTRIPMVADAVEQYFGKPPSKNVHPDEAVALGAAIMADSIVNRESDIQLLDVLPINIGLALPNGKILPVFERNTSVPNQKMKVFTTSQDNQESLKIKVVQGDRDKVDEGELIGDFIFRGIHPAAKGKARVEVIFTMNPEGLLSVTARDPDTGVEQSGVLQVSSQLQKSYHPDLITPKEVTAKKETSKIITRTVTREKKLAATSGPQSKAEGAGPPPAAANQTPPPAGAKKAGEITQPQKAAPGATPKPTPAPRPADREAKGFFARLRGWFGRGKR